MTDDAGSGSILVTGASGFIGRAVIKALIEAGHRPRALVRNRSGVAALKALGAEVFRGSLAQPGDSLDGVETMVNLAYDFRASRQANVADFESFLDRMAEAGVKRLIHASSIVVHDGWPRESLTEASPVTLGASDESYRGAKIECERLTEQAVTQGTLVSAAILRPTLVYGPGSRFWTEATVERLRGGPVVLPERPLDLPENAPFGLCHCVHVEDLAGAVVGAVAAREAGVRTYILSDPNPPDWAAFYQFYADVLDSGSVILKPYDDLAVRLPPDSGEPVDQGPGLAAKVSLLVRKAIGNDAVERVGKWLRNRRRDAESPQYPDRFLFDLYTSCGTMDVSAAREDLNFAPQKTAQDRVSEMAADLRNLK